MALSMAAKLVALTALCASAAARSSYDQSGANPIRKVVTLMQNMQKEIESEGAKEKELYEKFMCFCTGGADDLAKEIADAKAQIEELSGSVKSETAEKAQMEQEVIQHKTDLAAATEDLEEAAMLRKKESAEYDELKADSETNIKAMEGAIPALEKGMGGASLMQMAGNVGTVVRRAAERYANDFERKTVIAFLSQSGDYVPQSGQIVGILKAMLEDMQANLKKATEDETAAASGFAELKASKEAEAAAAKEAIQTKTVRQGELALTIVQNTNSLEDATKSAADNEKFLANLKESCGTKETEWAARCKARSEEITAISEAIGILNDDDALDVFKKAVPAALMQERLGFLQTSGQSASKLRKVQTILGEVQAMLKHRPAGTTPRLRAMLFSLKSKLRHLSRARATGDFDEVVGMVDGMVEVETEEQKNDDTQKPWCNGEFEKSDREDKAERTEISKLDALLQEESDQIEALTEEIKTLAGENAELDKSVAEATEDRKAEHEDYIESIQLSETAVKLVEKAKQRLLKFYNPTLYKAPPVKKEMTMEEKIIDAGSAASFLQLRRVRRAARMPEAPETFSGAVEKKSEKSSGVIALMDSITKELENDMKDGEYDEKTAQKDYAELMADSQETRQSNSAAITQKEAAKADLQSKKTQVREKETLDYQDVDNIAKYVGDLHGKCDTLLETYDAQKEARVKEVEGLKNAKAVLAGAKI